MSNFPVLCPYESDYCGTKIGCFSILTEILIYSLSFFSFAGTKVNTIPYEMVLTLFTLFEIMYLTASPSSPTCY